MWHVLSILIILILQSASSSSLLTCNDIKTMYNDADCTCASNSSTCLGAFNTTRYNILEQRVNALENLLAELDGTLLAQMINLTKITSIDWGPT